MPEDSERWTQFEQAMRAVDAAMHTEGVPADAAERVLNRVLYGGPDPDRTYRCELIAPGVATSFLFVWLDTVLALGGGRGNGHCLKCREPITAVTVGRREDERAPAWFQCDPCGCLFDVEPPVRRRWPQPGIRKIDKEYTPGTPLSPTQYLPMGQADPPAPTLSTDWAGRVLDQAPEVRRDA